MESDVKAILKLWDDNHQARLSFVRHVSVTKPCVCVFPFWIRWFHFNGQLSAQFSSATSNIQFKPKTIICHLGSLFHHYTTGFLLLSISGHPVFEWMGLIAIAIVICFCLFLELSENFSGLPVM
ncbi:hypothetical protein V6N13_003054 [Hibiscus sabdariffa]